MSGPKRMKNSAFDDQYLTKTWKFVYHVRMYVFLLS